jgi:hypothetical protein
MAQCQLFRKPPDRDVNRKLNNKKYLRGTGNFAGCTGFCLFLLLISTDSLRSAKEAHAILETRLEYGWGEYLRTDNIIRMFFKSIGIKTLSLYIKQK